MEQRRPGTLPSLNRSAVRPPTPGRWLVSGLTFFFLAWTAYRIGLQPNWAKELSGIWSELLSLLEMASTFTLTVLWGTLLWRRSRAQHHYSLISLENLRALSPKEFETFVARIFRRKGYEVTMRGSSGDQGVDLELAKAGGKRAIVQCKRYRSTIGPEIARELYGTLIHEGAAHAFLVTTSAISATSRKWAAGKSMTLIDGDTLVQLAAGLNLEDFH